MALTQPPVDVSVLLPAYNAEPFIARALESALLVKELSLEVVVVDDASTDGTVARVAALASRDNRIRLVQCAINGGPATARNIAIDHATGRWLALLDADDAFIEGQLEALVAYADRPGVDVAAFNFRYFDAVSGLQLGPGLHPRPQEELVTREALLKGSNANGRDYGLLKPVFRRAFVQQRKVRYEPQLRHGEDFFFVFDLVGRGASYYFKSSESSYLYTTRESGFSRTRIDDTSMLERVMSLRRSPDYSNDRNFARAVEYRIDVLRRLRLDRFAGGSSWRVKAYILIMALKDPTGRDWLYSWVMNKVKRRNKRAA